MLLHYNLIAAIPSQLIVFLVVMALMMFFIISTVSTYTKMLKLVKKGCAGVRTGVGGTEIGFDRILVFPIFHRYDEVDITFKRIDLDLTGPNGILSRDNIRIDLKVSFFIRINNKDKM